MKWKKPTNLPVTHNFSIVTYKIVIFVSFVNYGNKNILGGFSVQILKKGLILRHKLRLLFYRWCPFNRLIISRKLVTYVGKQRSWNLDIVPLLSNLLCYGKKKGSHYLYLYNYLIRWIFYHIIFNSTQYTIVIFRKIISILLP